MPALDFPNSPTAGQTFTPGGQAMNYIYDGAQWRLAASSTGSPSGRVAYAQVTATQSSIPAAGVDLTGLSVTWVADPTRTYKISSQTLMSPTTSGDAGGLFIFTGAGTQVARQDTHNLPSAGVYHGITCGVVLTGLSGSVTYKLHAKLISGSGSMSSVASTGAPAFILVEDITYQPGGGGGTAISNNAKTATPPILAQGVYINTSPIDSWYQLNGNICTWFAFVYPGTSGSGTGVIDIDLPVEMPSLLQSAGSGNAPNFAGTFMHAGYTKPIFGKLNTTRTVQVNNANPAITIAAANPVGIQGQYRYF